MVQLGGRRPSGNIEDRRPGGGRRSGLIVGLGFVSALAVGAASVAMTGVNTVLEWAGIERRLTIPEPRRAELDQFAAVILGDTERVWSAEFAAEGRAYPPPTLVFYEGQTTSGCGVVTADFGPVYCSFDAHVLIDLSFFDAVAGVFGAEGDFPPAYILAHEVAHHVQALTGDLDRFYRKLDAGAERANFLQVRLELQADCLAGVWTKKADQAFDLLDPGDLAEAIDAARIFGDDALQMQAQGAVNEAGFTHGAGEQRARWFMTGYETGARTACDTWTPAYGDL